MREPKRLRDAVSSEAAQRHRDRRLERGQVPDAHVDRAHASTGAQSDSEQSAVLRIAHRHCRADILTKSGQVHLSVQAALGGADRWEIEKKSQMRRQSQSSRMCDAMCVPQDDVG